MIKHCMKGEYSEYDQRMTCYRCSAPLSDNQLVKDAYKLNTTVSWAKNKLKILADMAESRNMQWFALEVKKIKNGLGSLDE